MIVALFLEVTSCISASFCLRCDRCERVKIEVCDFCVGELALASWAETDAINQISTPSLLDKHRLRPYRVNFQICEILLSERRGSTTSRERPSLHGVHNHQDKFKASWTTTCAKLTNERGMRSLDVMDTELAQITPPFQDLQIVHSCKPSSESRVVGSL